MEDLAAALPKPKAFTELDTAGDGEDSHLDGHTMESSHTLANSNRDGSSPIADEIKYKLPSRYLLKDGTPDYLRMILSSRVYDLVKETPLQKATHLSIKMEANCLFKREDLQPVFSFKIRGAYNMMASLTEEERWRGVVACSAGNHAQGVAISGATLGIPCTIVMPLATPSIKWRNVERLGSKVVLFGNDFDEAKLECNRLAEAHGLVNIPPYDEPYVIAGQGTLAMEILRQTNLEEVDALFVCVGGGGLLAGVASYVKRVAPEIRVIGVETLDADALTQSLEKGYPVVLKEVGLFADGTAVRRVGDETFRVCSQLVDEMISVSTDEICAAIKDIFEDTRSICEPSGALAIAGMKKWHEQQKRKSLTSQKSVSKIINQLSNGTRHQDPPEIPGQPKRPTYVGVVSGANMNFDRLRFVAERAELGEGREVLLSAIIPEKAGAFIALHSHIHPRAITEFNYRYSSETKAYIYLSFRVKEPKRRKEEVQAVIEAIESESLAGQQFIARDISGDEMSKSHGRYLIGGRSKVEHERLYRFEFPERPNALYKFLHGLNAGFNISLFHYRNHGSDLGKVLVGIQVPPSSHTDFQSFLDSLQYPYVDESENPVYKEFLT